MDNQEDSKSASTSGMRYFFESESEDQSSDLSETTSEEELIFENSDEDLNSTSSDEELSSTSSDESDNQSSDDSPFFYVKDESDNIPSLAYFSLSYSLIHTMKVINYIDDLEEDEDSKDKKYQTIVNYYKPLREFLASVPMMFDMYEDQEAPTLAYLIGKCAYIFWLCYRNIESQKLRIDHYFEDKAFMNYRIDFISKSQEQFKFCTFLKLNNERKSEPMDLMNFFNNGERFPALQELDIEFKLPVIFEEMFAVILPKLKRVTKLKVCIRNYFCFVSFAKNIEQSPQLENVEIQCNKFYKINYTSKNRIKNWNVLLTALKKLKHLKYFKISDWVSENYHDNEVIVPKEAQTKVENVKSLSLIQISVSDLTVIDQHFVNVQKLELKSHQPWRLLRNLTLQSLKTITCLKISSYRTKENISHFLEVFPNLIELEIDAAVKKDDNLKEVKSLKKFVILGNKIENPNCLLKMPNLQHFSMAWSKLDKMKEVEALKPFLPLQCKIYDRVEDDKIEYDCLRTQGEIDAISNIFKHKKMSCI